MRLLFRWLRRLVYLLVAVAFVYLVVTSIEVVTASRSPQGGRTVTPADAIVVLGSATSRSGISPDLKARCEQAASLVGNHKAPLVIATGGPAGAGDPSEASVARAYLLAHGAKTVKEVPAATIPAQLAVVRSLLSGTSGNRVILVADPLQTKWLTALATAEDLVVQVDPAPTPKGSFWSDVGTIWNQSLAVALGRIIGYQHTGWIGG